MTDGVQHAVIRDPAYARRLRAFEDEHREVLGRAGWSHETDEQLDLVATRSRANGLRFVLRSAMRPLFVRGTTDVHREIAAAVLRAEKVDDDSARELLAVELWRSFSALAERLEAELRRLDGNATAWVVRDGVLSLDAIAAEYLEGVGPEGAKVAVEVRDSARRRWVATVEGQLELPLVTMCATASPPEKTSSTYLFWLWLNPTREPTPVLFAFTLACVLWRDIVRARVIEPERKPPAISIAVIDRIAGALRPGVHKDGKHLVDAKGSLVANLEMEDMLGHPALEVRTIEALLPRGVQLLGRSINAFRLLYWEVITGHHRVLRGEQDPRLLCVPGGWSGLAEVIGAASSNEARAELHAMVIAQAHLYWKWPDGSHGNLISYRAPPPAGRHHSTELRIILGDALLPGFVDSIRGRRARSAREARRLVPITGLPPFVGRARDWPAQPGFHLRIMAELRRRAREVAARGGALLAPARLAELAGQAGLPATLLGRVMDRWTQDGADGHAVLERVETDRYTIGRAYPTARDFLARGGEQEERGREDAARGPRRRRRGPDGR